jgi:molybdopterin-synthase adenylyltransferase
LPIAIILRSALEIAPSQINQLASQAGYLENVPDPAVFWLNNICASTAVGIIHGIMSNYLNCDEGLDWIYQFPSQEWLKTNPDHLYNDDCLFCVNSLTSESPLSEQGVFKVKFCNRCNLFVIKLLVCF